MASFSLSAKTSSDPPASKRKKEEPEGETDDTTLLQAEQSSEPEPTFSLLLKGDRHIDFFINFDGKILAVGEPERVPLSELALLIETKAELKKKEKKQDLKSCVVVKCSGVTQQKYQLRQRLYESNRLRLGHLLPFELLQERIYRCDTKWMEEEKENGREQREEMMEEEDEEMEEEEEEEEERQSAQEESEEEEEVNEQEQEEETDYEDDYEEEEEREVARGGGLSKTVCTVVITLKVLPREREMRRVCGTIFGITCSIEVLSLYSSNPSVFPFSYVISIDNVEVADREMHFFTLRLVDLKKLTFKKLSDLKRFLTCCYSYGFSSLVSPLVQQHVVGRRLDDDPAAEVLKLAVVCGNDADKFLPSYLDKFPRLECLRKMWQENRAQMTPTVTSAILERMCQLGSGQKASPEIIFIFEEGRVKVQLLGDLYPQQSERLLTWMRDRNPTVVARRKKNGVALSRAVPHDACGDPNDAEGRWLRIDCLDWYDVSRTTPNYRFYGEPVMMELVHRMVGYREVNHLRFARHCGQPIGIVLEGEGIIKNLTHLVDIQVTDVVKYRIAETD